VTDQVSHPHTAASRTSQCLPTSSLQQRLALAPLSHVADRILIFLYLITILKEMNAGKKFRQI
jgi:hypothetical protein